MPSLKKKKGPVPASIKNIQATIHDPLKEHLKLLAAYFDVTSPRANLSKFELNTNQLSKLSEEIEWISKPSEEESKAPLEDKGDHERVIKLLKIKSSEISKEKHACAERIIELEATVAKQLKGIIEYRF